MDKAEVIQVIKTTLLRRGTGESVDDPIRVVTQFWSLSGELLWEDDPRTKMLFMRQTDGSIIEVAS